MIEEFDAQKDEKIIFAIMKETRNLNKKDIDGNNPLLFSLIHGHANIAVKLIEAGADIYVANKQGKSAIELIIKKQSLTLIKALIAKGFDFNTVNGKKQSILHQAIDTFDNTKDDKAIFAIIKESHNLNHQDIYGNNPLLVSLLLGHENIALKLIEAGADIFVLNAQGQSVIELAVKQNSLSLIHALMARGADLNIS